MWVSRPLLALLLAVPAIQRKRERPKPRHGNLEVAGYTSAIEPLRVAEERLLDLLKHAQKSVHLASKQTENRDLCGGR